MKKTYGWALVVSLWLVFPCCKTDKTDPKPAKAPEKVPAEVKEPRVEQQPPAQPEEKTPVDASARKAVDGFLKAATMLDSQEGKKVLAETRWRKTMKFPEFQKLTTLSEEMFPTDIPEVKGYKRVVSLIIPREGRKPFVKPHMLIAYEDTKQKAWKVFDFTAVADVQIGSDRACEEKALAEGEGTTLQGRLMNCSYWLVMSGKIEEAEKAAKKANTLYEKVSEPDDEARYYKGRADATLEMISRMAGDHT